MATKAPKIGTIVKGYDGTGPDWFHGTVGVVDDLTGRAYVDYTYVQESMFRHVLGGWHTPDQLREWRETEYSAWETLP